MEIAIQQPLQMPFTLLSTLEPGESSARIASSPGIAGPLVTVPSMRPPVAPPGGLPAVPAEPTGPPPAPDADPEEFAVPAELVPSALAPFAPLEPTPEAPAADPEAPPDDAPPADPPTPDPPLPPPPPHPAQERKWEKTKLQ